MQLAAEQHAPIAHTAGPVQSVVQVLPLQRIRPAQAPLPRQEMLFPPASASTPVRARLRAGAGHLAGDARTADPAHARAGARTDDRVHASGARDAAPARVAAQTRDRTRAAAALNRTRARVLVAAHRAAGGDAAVDGARGTRTPDIRSSTRSPPGHLISPVQGLQGVPQTNEQVPPMQLPPAAMQSSHALVATGVPRMDATGAGAAARTRRPPPDRHCRPCPPRPFGRPRFPLFPVFWLARPRCRPYPSSRVITAVTAPPGPAYDPPRPEPSSRPLEPAARRRPAHRHRRRAAAGQPGAVDAAANREQQSGREQRTSRRAGDISALDDDDELHPDGDVVALRARLPRILRR